MKFSELESFMHSKGVSSLAEIARALDTTPQAVSNWKARDQVPFRIVSKIKNLNSYSVASNMPFANKISSLSTEAQEISFSDILLTMAEQLKVIIIIPFIAIFLTFTYTQFIQNPTYQSMATVLLPTNKPDNIGVFGGLASQCGVNVPSGGQVDLSSPSLFPELLKSRTFAEKILYKKFYTKKFGVELSLLAILTHGNDKPLFGEDTLITEALGPLQSIMEFEEDVSSTFNIIRVTTFEPVFAKELAEEVLLELESLNRFFRSQSVNEKTTFINQRILAVREDLEASEQSLKAFNEQNRQISSPALRLEEERLNRDVEIQKGIFLTLKQQLELAKIEQVQEASIVQVLDKPQIPLGPNNKNLKVSIFVAGFLGLGLGLIFAFIRSYLDHDDMDERRKLRRMRNFLKKKTKDIILDRRVSGIVSFLFLIGLPFYLGHESSNPVFFGMYSRKLMLLNTIYVITLIFSMSLFIYNSRKK